MEGILRNPGLFERGSEEDDWYPTSAALGKLGREYLELVRRYPPKDMRCVRSHLMWMLGKEGRGDKMTFEHVGPFNHSMLRSFLVEGQTIEDFETIINAVFQ